MTEAMPFLQKAILLSYDPRPFRRVLFVFFSLTGGSLLTRSLILIYPQESGLEAWLSPPVSIPKEAGAEKEKPPCFYSTTSS